MRIAAGIEYCGRSYSGWQRQDHARTVQAVVEAAFTAVANQPVQVHCAGRTDAGVHALQQVVHFDTDAVRRADAWMMGANVNLPQDVSVSWAKTVPAEFHARYSATGRTYRYLIFNRRSRSGLLSGLAAWEYRHLDCPRMASGARALLGEHDYSAFRAQACQSASPVREVRRLEVHREGDLVVLEIEANAFLQHMVRNIAGLLMAIGAGERPVDWAREVLESRDRTRGGVTAPSAGLYLVEAVYAPVFEIPRNTLACPVRELARRAS